MDFGTRERRDREFEQCRNKHEVDQLMDRWNVEDAESLLATKRERQQLDDLRQRVRQLEATVAAMPGALGTVIGKHVRQVLDQRAPLAYQGTWNAEEDYARNCLVTHDGGMWLAIGAPTKGRRPKVDPSWRLVVKSAPDGGFA